jgi:hypothetical protein
MALPGADLAGRGLADPSRGEETIALLRREHGDDAHGRYNALVRRPDQLPARRRVREVADA